MIGEPRTHVEETESTQLLLGPDDPEGAIATTDHQTGGRGRRHDHGSEESEQSPPGHTASLRPAGKRIVSRP